MTMAEAGGGVDNTPLVRDALTSAVAAVTEEMRASAADPASRYQLRDGRFVARSGIGYLWSFETDGEVSLEPDLSGQLLIDGVDPLAVTVVATGDLDLVLSLREDVGETVRRCTLVARPLFILEALRDRLQDAESQLLDTSVLEQMLDLTELEDHPGTEDDEPRPTPNGDEYSAEAGDDDNEPGLSHEQLLAAEHATQDGLRIVWGPPGTGKTSTLAATVVALAESGRRVLVVSHSNAAVDVAMVRVADFMRGTELLDQGKVLRVGYPQLPEARECGAILPDAILGQRFPEMAEQRKALETQLSRLSGQIRRNERADAELAKELEHVREQLRELDRRSGEGQAELIREARVVGCTLAKVVIDTQLWGWARDAIIVDEASMAGLPYLAALAASAPRTFACFGDFRQLPPIAISESPSAKAWFGRDIFQLAGVVRRVEGGEPDPRLAILRTQYRMGETIAAAVSDVAYYSLLYSHIDAIARAHDLARHDPLAGTEVAIIDISRLQSSCLVDSERDSFTRFNLRAAALTVSLAQTAQASGLEVGVISPYRGQVAVAGALLRSSGITAATMHRFQGSEREAIILDLVDTHPEKGPSRLTGKNDDLALRLLNVGISRAKAKLLIVCDVPFLRERSPNTSPALKFLDAFIELGAPVVDAAALIGLPSTDSVEWSSDWWDCITSLARTGRPAGIRIGLNDAAFGAPDVREQVVALRSLAETLTVHAPITIARGLEGAGAELKLKPFAPGQLAICHGKGVVIGGSSPDQPTAVLKGAAVANVVQRLLLREA